MKKLIAISKDGKSQAILVGHSNPKKTSVKKEFLGNRALNKVPMIGHKTIRLITN